MECGNGASPGKIIEVVGQLLVPLNLPNTGQ